MALQRVICPPAARMISQNLGDKRPETSFVLESPRKPRRPKTCERSQFINETTRHRTCSMSLDLHKFLYSLVVKGFIMADIVAKLHSPENPYH